MPLVRRTTPTVIVYLVCPRFGARVLMETRRRRIGIATRTSKTDGRGGCDWLGEALFLALATRTARSRGVISSSQ
jgi:hypothetical protein